MLRCLLGCALPAPLSLHQSIAESLLLEKTTKSIGSDLPTHPHRAQLLLPAPTLLGTLWDAHCPRLTPHRQRVPTEMRGEGPEVSIPSPLFKHRCHFPTCTKRSASSCCDSCDFMEALSTQAWLLAARSPRPAGAPRAALGILTDSHSWPTFPKFDFPSPLMCSVPAQRSSGSRNASCALEL